MWLKRLTCTKYQQLGVVYVRYSDLSDNLLIESYQKAVELDLDISFIALLENELLVRYILHYKQSKLEIKS